MFMAVELVRTAVVFTPAELVFRPPFVPHPPSPLTPAVVVPRCGVNAGPALPRRERRSGEESGPASSPPAPPPPSRSLVGEVPDATVTKVWQCFVSVGTGPAGRLGEENSENSSRARLRRPLLREAGTPAGPAHQPGGAAMPGGHPEGE